MIGKCTEDDMFWFDMANPPYARYLFVVSFVDDDWVYMRQSCDKRCDYKTHRRSGELRKFVGDSWEIVPGRFEAVVSGY